jgi:hypothetical protein
LSGNFFAGTPTFAADDFGVRDAPVKGFGPEWTEDLNIEFKSRPSVAAFAALTAEAMAS